jgi:hypothetical protein
LQLAVDFGTFATRFLAGDESAAEGNRVSFQDIEPGGVNVQTFSV